MGIATAPPIVVDVHFSACRWARLRARFATAQLGNVGIAAPLLDPPTGPCERPSTKAGRLQRVDPLSWLKRPAKNSAQGSVESRPRASQSISRGWLPSLCAHHLCGSGRSEGPGRSPGHNRLSVDKARDRTRPIWAKARGHIPAK